VNFFSGELGDRAFDTPLPAIKAHRNIQCILDRLRSLLRCHRLASGFARFHKLDHQHRCHFARLIGVNA
jgi:hypothetical protein